MAEGTTRQIPDGQSPGNPPALTSAQSTNAQLLAMLLDDQMRNPQKTWVDCNRFVKNVWYCAALAAQLDYPVIMDDDGYVHIYLPTSTTDHVVFFIGLGSYQTRPLAPAVKWAIDAYFEQAIPAWQRARIEAVRDGRDPNAEIGSDAGC